MANVFKDFYKYDKEVSEAIGSYIREVGLIQDRFYAFGIGADGGLAYNASNSLRGLLRDIFGDEYSDGPDGAQTMSDWLLDAGIFEENPAPVSAVYGSDQGSILYGIWDKKTKTFYLTKVGFKNKDRLLQVINGPVDDMSGDDYDTDGDDDYDEVSTAEAVAIAFPELSPGNQDLVASWYRNEGAAEDFSNNQDFADFISRDIDEMIDASDYNSDEVRSLIDEMLSWGYLRDDLWSDRFEESYSRRRRVSRNVRESRRYSRARKLRESENLMLRARELADEYVAATPGGHLYDLYCLVDLNNSVRTPRLHGYRDRDVYYPENRRSFAKSCGIKYPGSTEMSDWVDAINEAGNPNNVFAIWTPEAMYPTEYGKQNADKFIQALENSIAYQHKRGW